MKQEYKDRFPKFCNDNDDFYDLCLSDDSDSILVTNFIQDEKWDDVKFFYDFNMLYIEKGYKQENKILGCDIDFIMGDARCWSNHVTALSKNDRFNTNSANLNNIDKISRANYTDKYAGSTLVIVLSYYNYDISQLSEEGKMLIMCIDSHYYGFYNGFHETQRKWLVDVLQYPELYDIIKIHKEQDFIDLARKYNIKIPRQKKKDRDGKIWINQDGYLETEIDLKGISDVLDTKITLPTCQFVPFFKESKDKEYIKMKQMQGGTKYINSRKQIHNYIFTYAQTYRNTASLTVLEKINPNKK